MIKLLKNKIIIFSTCLFIILILLFALFNMHDKKMQNNVNKDNFTYNQDGSVTLGLGMVANGFNNQKTKKIIDSGSLLKPMNGSISGQVSFKQNIEGKRNYLLLVMIDYLQHKFIANGKSYTSYPFSLEDNEELLIDVGINDLNNTSHEFTYFIVPEPEMTELSIKNNEEWNKLNMTSSTYWWRLLLDDEDKKNLIQYKK